MKRKLGFSTFCFLCAVLLAMASEGSAAILPKPFQKEDYIWEDTILTGVEPNILFFLDTSSSMTMSMTGELPTWNGNDTLMRNTMPLMRNADRRAAMLRGATYGMGARPMSTGTQTLAQRIAANGVPATGTEKTGYLNSSGYATSVNNSDTSDFTRWGADRDNTNNVIASADCYYSPDPNKPYLLTFKNSAWANWDGKDSPPAGFPTALLAYLPGHSKAGQSVTDAALIDQYLVPNDSKMYQMKLVLWRMLQEENAQMLSGMRIGVAGNFFDYAYGNPAAAMMRRSPFGSSKYFYAYHQDDGNNANDYQRYTHFPYGTAPETYSGIPGGDYGYQSASYMVVTTAYLAAGDQPTQRHELRAYLRIPFDYMYLRNPNGTYSTTETLFAFRELIDGVEQYDTSKSGGHMWANDELYPGGTALLASSFYGRDGLHVSNYNPDDATSGTNLSVMHYQKAVQYATGSLTSRSFWDGYSAYRYQGSMSKRFKTSEGLMAGVAMGSFIDFFSPFKDLGFTAATGTGQNIRQPAESVDTRGYFPIMGACQPNWVIVFTGGNELATTRPENRNSVISPNEQLLRLYQNSRTMRGRKWDGEKWVATQYDMDSPIRTVFVGIMPAAEPGQPDGDPYAPNQPLDSDLKKSRKRITQMAHHGQPKMQGGVAVRDETIQPHFADNVPKLVEALNAILRQIQTDRFASSAPVVMPPENGSSDGTVFGATYVVNQWKQWDGAFHKYKLYGLQTKTPIWQAEELIRTKAMNRNLYTVNGTSGEVSVKGLSAQRFAELTRLSAAPTPRVNAFQSWLYTYDDEPSVLGDMEHTGITVVQAPKLEGMAAAVTRTPLIYIQTNRGVLHAIDLTSGDEKWGFFPPNVFQTRLWAQKFAPDPDDLSSPRTDAGAWYTGDGRTAAQSKPLALLDGMVSAGDFKDRLGQYRTALIGNLGYGGNGLYAMDITNGDNTPHFLWAVENARYDTQEADPLDGVKLWGAAASGSKANYDYSDLGMTVVAADVRVTDSSNGVGILPGGLGYLMGANSHGKVFYFFDPENGQILNKIDGTSNRFIPAPGIPLGMGVTPVTSIPKGTGSSIVKEFFTGDSQGNVLYSDMNGNPSTWKMKSIFQLRTTGALTGTPGNPVALTKALQVGRTRSGDRWLWGGTSSLIAPGKRKLNNDEQYIFGVRLTHTKPEYLALYSKLMDMSGPTADAYTTADLTKLNYAADTIMPAYNPSAHNSGGVDEINADAKGWRLMLRPPVTDPKLPTEGEYVTTSPFLYGGVLYVSTYIERTRNPSEEKCPDIGDAKFYSLDPTTGRAAWKSGKQGIVLRNVKIAGVSADSDGYLYLALKELKPGAWANAVAENPMDLEDVQELGAGLYRYRAAARTNPPDIPFDVPLVQYWKESF